MRMAAEIFTPGSFIKDEIDARGWTQDELAWRLCMSRPHITMVLNGRSRIEVELAIRLAKVLDINPEYILNLQRAYDFWMLQKKYGKNFQKVKIRIPKTKRGTK